MRGNGVLGSTALPLPSDRIGQRSGAERGDEAELGEDAVLGCCWCSLLLLLLAAVLKPSASRR
jgi:hypothetical protein